MARRGSRRGHPTVLEKTGSLALQIVVGVPVLIAYWLFAQFVKLRAWMKGY